MIYYNVKGIHIFYQYLHVFNATNWIAFHVDGNDTSRIVTNMKQ